MAGAGAGTDQGPEVPGPPEAAGPGDPRAGSDWAGLPEHLLMKVAGKLVAQTEAGWAAHLKERGWNESMIQEKLEERERDGICCLFVFAMVCKTWRKAQLKVGGPLRTRVKSDVILPGRVELVKWALAEGCPRESEFATMAEVAAQCGHMELVRWLIQEQGFAMEWKVMALAAHGGNLEVVQWLRGEGCPWNWIACNFAVKSGHTETLRWLRENGCPWKAFTRDKAAEKLGYTDDFGNLA